MKEGKGARELKRNKKGTRQTENNTVAMVGSSLPIITLNENELNSPIRRCSVADGQRNKIQLYAVHKRLTLFIYFLVFFFLNSF